jgi:hypothetical protein
MPLKKDPKGGGKNADGSTNKMYCSLCYEDGKFLQPDVTALEMKEFVKNQLKRMGFPGFLAGFFSKKVPKLERWKQQN